CGHGVEPEAGGVDPEPGKRPQERHQRQRTQPSPPFDPARERKLNEHDRQRVEEEDESDLALRDMAVVADERWEQIDERIPRTDEQEVQRPEADEETVA